MIIRVGTIIVSRGSARLTCVMIRKKKFFRVAIVPAAARILIIIVIIVVVEGRNENASSRNYFSNSSCTRVHALVRLYYIITANVFHFFFF